MLSAELIPKIIADFKTSLEQYPILMAKQGQIFTLADVLCDLAVGLEELANNPNYQCPPLHPGESIAPHPEVDPI
jgi:hypothetical protein